ncbi:tyrosine-type recombinase/integrase [Bacteroides acidifaciens]|uniref:tyrosine-type recombinase/integrase n=1 Tax=Bacteroides acidifaciens TaxID=85831 RepID=UPI0025AE8507|nr:tyrosine-type recombinase/integrase [Bacteroides acidifaciens]
MRAWVFQIIEESGIAVGNRHHGAHSLRHSLASCLINYETPIPVITGILGHESSTTTMTYLHLDINSLLKCSLPVPAVDDNFYTQRGGAFYE